MTDDDKRRTVNYAGSMWAGGTVQTFEETKTVAELIDVEGEKAAREVLRAGSLELNSGRRCVLITLNPENDK